MINPINHMRTPDEVERYRVEPYAVAADVYAHPMHVGRGGWTWYTGSAGWMYQAAIDGLLGLRRHGDTFTVSPCIPAMWSSCSLDWKHGRSLYRIAIQNPERQHHGVQSAMLDGVEVEPQAIPLHDDGRDARRGDRAGERHDAALGRALLQRKRSPAITMYARLR